MSFKIKSIIAGGVVILILTVLLVSLLQFSSEEKLDFFNDISPINLSDFDNPLALIEKEHHMIENIKIKNKSDEYVIEKIGEDEWGIKELQDFNLITNYSSMLKTISNFMAVEIVEKDAEDLSIFGFETPNITIDVEFNDMQTYQIKVGDISSQTDTAYVIIDDNPTVYRFYVNTFSDFLLSKKAFISTNVIPALSKVNNVTTEPNYTYMKLEREDLQDNWEFENITETTATKIKFINPVECYVNSEQFSKYFENYFGFSALSIETINPTVEQLKDYGFDKPYAKFNTIYADGELEFTLIVGDKISTQGFNSRYLMLEGTDLVYIVETNKLPFLTVKTSDFISPILVQKEIDEFSEVEITIAGQKTNFEIWEENDLKIQNNDYSYSYADAVLKVNKNGESFNVDIFTQYMQTLSLTNITDITDKKPVGNPNISIKYTYLDETSETDENEESLKIIETVDVYEQSDKTSIICLNKKYYFIEQAGYISKVKEQTEYLLNR